MASLQRRRLWSVSPSAVDTYQKCKRLWWRNYVIGQRGPTPSFMAKGTSIHAALEHYLQTGDVLVDHENADAPGVKWEVMQFVQCAIAYQRDGQTLVPPPLIDPYWKQWPKGSAGLMLEQAGPVGTWSDLGDGSGGGPEWRQYIDVVEAYPDRAVICDWKTTSNLLYAKTPDELSHNVQLIGNAKWLLSVSDYTEITLRHFYLCTKNKRPKALAVDAVVSREHVETEWQKILAIVREMVAYRQLDPSDPNLLPPNTDHCSAYGGCAHRQACGLMPGENSLISANRLKGKGEVATMGLLEKMLAKGGAAAGLTGNEPKEAPKAVPETVAAPAALPSGPAKGGLLDRLKKQEAAPAVAPEVQKAPTTAGELPGYDPNGIVPPDAPLPTSTPEEVAAVSAEKSPAPAPADAPAEPAKRARRRTKEEMAAARALEALSAAKPLEKVVEEVNTNANVVAQAYTQPKPPLNPLENVVVVGLTQHELPSGATTSLGLTAGLNDQRPTEGATKGYAEETEAQNVAKMLLTPDPAFDCPVQAVFIDCLPGKGWPGDQPTDLNEIMHTFNGLAASSAGTTDYRLIRYESAGYLATAIKAMMKGLPPTIFVDSRTPGANVFLETVIPYARLVVRGVR